MSREFIELLKRQRAAREIVVKNLNLYLCRILQIARELDPSAEVYLFGSFARGAPRPDSDVDVLVISDATGRDLLSAAMAVDRITAELGVSGVFEIHVATRELFERWYRRFIDVMVLARCEAPPRG
ncbi:MAG: nucleotidyltransferase domain-containing protein [Thermoproteaceae archaeon]|nr:nucleotidyltransferase domain-containing protein [Thermoproteaceae archaeon]